MVIHYLHNTQQISLSNSPHEKSACIQLSTALNQLKYEQEACLPSCPAVLKCRRCRFSTPSNQSVDKQTTLEEDLQPKLTFIQRRFPIDTSIPIYIPAVSYPLKRIPKTITRRSRRYASFSLAQWLVFFLFVIHDKSMGLFKL